MLPRTTKNPLVVGVGAVGLPGLFDGGRLVKGVVFAVAQHNILRMEAHARNYATAQVHCMIGR